MTVSMDTWLDTTSNHSDLTPVWGLAMVVKLNLERVGRPFQFTCNLGIVNKTGRMGLAGQTNLVTV